MIVSNGKVLDQCPLCHKWIRLNSEYRMKVTLLKWCGSYGIYKVGVRNPLVFVASHPAHAESLYRKFRHYEREAKNATKKIEVEK